MGAPSTPEGQRWAHAPGVHAVELDGEAVLYDERSEQLHLLNSSASIIWACLDGRVTLGQLIVELADGLGVTIETMRSDITGAVDAMVSQGLLIPDQMARGRRTTAPAGGQPRLR